MRCSVKVFEKVFEGESAKQAYMRSCKWLASHVISKRKELGNKITYEVEKFVDEDGIEKVRLVLFATIEEKVLEERHCTCCKEMHNLFYINEQYDCNKCSMRAYNKRREEALNNARKFLKEKLELDSWEG